MAKITELLHIEENLTKNKNKTNIKYDFRLVGGAIMNYIERAITPILKKRVNSSKCVLITGARQVGKSTLVKHEFPEYNRANFDDRLTRLQAKEEPKRRSSVWVYET